MAAAADAGPTAGPGRDLLRFITCGSVDDGKSTLLGRLLLETGSVPDDLLAALDADSRRFGTQGDAIDPALLLDGLASEREQGITIDVAWRYFATPARAFIVADCPGHEQYTRNMATGASNAEAAVLLVDARRGLQRQTRRHATIVDMMGIREVVLAVNKMDLVGFDPVVFQRIVEDFSAWCESLAIRSIHGVPVAALAGDNVVTRSPAMPWYDGPPLLELLETLDPEREPLARPFRMPVQWVNRPDASFRGFSGRVCAGTAAPGTELVVLPSGVRTRLARVIRSLEAPADAHGVADAGRSVTLVLEDEVDVSRGDVIAAADAPPEVSDQFEAQVLWLSEHALLPGRTYLFKLGSAMARATVHRPKFRLDVDDGQHIAAPTLELNEIGVLTLSLDRRIVFEPYTRDRVLGGFILIDPLGNDTVGMGLIRFALRRATNVHWQALEVSKATRAAQKSQRPLVLWFTGLSGAGKSTIANRVEQRLLAMGKHTYLLDGDNVRHGLNRDLGFKDTDRVENIRRVGEVAKLMVDAGLITLVSFISPFRAEREMARRLLEDGEFVEIFVDASLAAAEARDPKGLYAKARAGEIRNFTGIDSPYEPPEAPELRIDTEAMSAEAASGLVIEYLQARGALAAP